MAMVIVMTASFIVLVTIGIGAALIVKNIDSIGGGLNLNRAASNLQSALERIRGMARVNGDAFVSCGDTDCINTSTGSCGVCADTIISLGNGNSHKVKIDTISQPGLGIPGLLTYTATGYYKNVSKSKSGTVCLNYCSTTGRNCGDDGCGGSCGNCTPPQVCGGAGTPGICGGATACDNIAVECGDECVEGDTCGGGTVINANNNIVLALGGCADESGTQCGETIDQLVKVWDNSGGHYEQTNATVVEDGRTNTDTLKGIDISRFDAVRFCDELSFNGFSSWYLPASKEINLPVVRDNNWATNFADGCYWASTETSADDAHKFDLAGLGGCAGNTKDNAYYVRCIRRY